jgi:hypothetical protein
MRPSLPTSGPTWHHDTLSTRTGFGHHEAVQGASMKRGPERFGRYVVRDVLGQGGMGAVYLAHDELLHREVAVKTMLAWGLSGPMAEMFTQRFFVEARAASAVTHANVVQIFDMGVQDDVPYLVMELVRGHSLKERLGKGLLTAEDAQGVGMQIARALGVAHAAGILHRDVKPANVLEAESGVWKLADFGVARMPDSSLTMTGQFIGSPAYAAPESFTQGEFTTAADIYSLGASLYEALSGTAPYGQRDSLALVVAMTRESPRDLAELRPDLPPALCRAIALAMARNPAERPSAAGFVVLLGDLRAPVPEVRMSAPFVTAPTVAAGSSPGLVSMAPAAPLAAPPVPGPQRPWLWPLIGGGILLVLLGIGIGKLSGGSAAGSAGVSPWAAAARQAPLVPVGRRSRDAQKQWDKAQDKLAEGKLREAAKHLEELLEKSPGDPQAELLLQQIRASGRDRWREDD